MNINEKIRLIRKLVLIAIFSDDELMDKFVVKGGSAIDLVYRLDSRASKDIDLSIENDFSEEELFMVKQRLAAALQQTFEEHGYTVLDFKMISRPKVLKETLQGFWGGYEVSFKILSMEKKGLSIADSRMYAEVLGEDQGKTFTIDISKYECCKQKNQIEFEGLTIYVYSPKMLVIEKLRAICQQMAEYQVNGGKTRNPRSKDFYDIALLISHYGLILDTSDLDLIHSVFALKKVDLDLLRLIPKYKDFFSQDLDALRATLTASALSKFQFDDCFTVVVIIANQILAYNLELQADIKKA